MKSYIREFIFDLKEFLGVFGRYIFKNVYRVSSGFEVLKRGVASGLYRQRGRFTRPFVHTAMGGVVAMGVVLAPVLASSFPGVDKAPGDQLAPSEQVMEVTNDNTATEVSDKVRDKVMEYQVQQGDTVSTIAEKFGISTDTIRWENDLSSINAIKPDQTLRILPVTGVRHKVGRGETIYSIAKKYDANPQAIVDFPFNTFTDNETFALAVGQDLIVPDGKKPNEVQWSPQTPAYASRLTPDAGSVTGTGSFAWPIRGVLTQYFNWYHTGIDIATAFGTPVVAADSGVVVQAGWPDNSGYGNRVIIDHKNGYYTLYGHLSKISVVEGQSVNRGDVIGLEGSTGRSTGPHVHFEVRKGAMHGTRLNPLSFLK